MPIRLRRFDVEFSDHCSRARRPACHRTPLRLPERATGEVTYAQPCPLGEWKSSMRKAPLGGFDQDDMMDPTTEFYSQCEQVAHSLNLHRTCNRYLDRLKGGT